MFKNYCIIAFRNILRNRTISFINIFGLAVSMSICLLLILIVADQFSYDTYHTKKDRIHRINTDRTQLKEYVWSTATTAGPMADYVRDHESIEKSVQVGRRFSGIAAWEDQEIPFSGYYSENTFFEVFDFPLEQGNMSEALSLPNSMVITKKLSDRIFGEKNPLNEIVEVEDKGQFIITGVLAEFPGKTHFDFEALASIDYVNSIANNDSTGYSSQDDWENIYDTYVYVLLKENARPDDLQPLLARASQEHYPREGDYEYDFYLQKLTGITPGPLLSNNAGFGLPDFMIYVMLGIALVVLCSACFNYANLTTARAVNRAREIGVRKIVGARNTHVFGQFMIEAVLTALISFIFADLIVQFLLPRFNSYLVSLGAPFGFHATPDLYVWFILFVIVAGLLAGLVPALFFSSTKPLQALKKTIQIDQLGRRLGFKRIDVRKILVVVQFAFTIFFVITIITIYQQTRFVLTTDHGFKTEGVINVKLQGLSYEKLKQELTGLSDIRLVAAATHLPALGTNNNMEIDIVGEEDPVLVSYFGVDEGYVDALGLQMLAGKGFSDNMPEDEKYILVNETFVTRFGWENEYDAIGQLVTSGDQQLEIIGVLKDFHYERLDEKIGPMALRYIPSWANHAILLVNNQNTKESLSQVENTWKTLTNRPFEYTLFEDDLRLSYGHFEALLLILGYVTFITVSIACLGLLGMVIYHIQNKTKELGIRKTLGAGAKDILLNVSRGFILLISIAYIIAGPLAYFVNNAWLQSNEYRIDFGITTLMLGFVMVLLIVALTIGSQLYKAMNINPVDSLRSE
jgi:putative ABC transport system permease protein